MLTIRARTAQHEYGWLTLVSFARSVIAMRKTLLLLCCAVLFACSKQPATEREKLEKNAAQGDANAQFSLGAMYASGKGVPTDEAKAVEWFEKAAAQGNANAQFFLGAMYANGKGVAKDDAKAVEWWEKAAAQGNANAQLLLKKRKQATP